MSVSGFCSCVFSSGSFPLLGSFEVSNFLTSAHRQPLGCCLPVGWGIPSQFLTHLLSDIRPCLMSAWSKASWYFFWVGVFVWWEMSCSVPVIAFQSRWIRKCLKILLLGIYWSRVIPRNSLAMNKTCGFCLSVYIIHSWRRILLNFIFWGLKFSPSKKSEPLL